MASIIYEIRFVIVEMRKWIR